MEGMSHKEIGNNLGLSEGNARVKLNRTKEKIQQIIKNQVMNFDQLKEQWNKEDSDVHIPDTIKQLKESKHPIEKIQKNMKKEFPMQILAIILIAFFPFTVQIPSFTVHYLLCILYDDGGYLFILSARIL